MHLLPFAARQLLQVASERLHRLMFCLHLQNACQLGCQAWHWRATE